MFELCLLVGQHLRVRPLLPVERREAAKVLVGSTPERVPTAVVAVARGWIAVVPVAHGTHNGAEALIRPGAAELPATILYDLSAPYQARFVVVCGGRERVCVEIAESREWS